MDKKLFQTPYLLIIIPLFIILVLINIILNFELNIDDLDLNEIIIRTVPPLSGAFFSGIVAYIIFHLTKQKEKDVKASESKNSLEIINQELFDNLQNALSLKKALLASSPSTIAHVLNSEAEKDEKDSIKKFEVIEANFSTQIIDNLISKLSNSDYLLVANEIKSIKMIIKSLKLLTEKDCGLNNRILLVENLLLLIDKLEKNNKSRNNNESIKEKFLTLDSLILQYTVRCCLLLIILITSLYFLIR